MHKPVKCTAVNDKTLDRDAVSVQCWVAARNITSTGNTVAAQ